MTESGLRHRVALIRTLPARARLAALVAGLEIAPPSERETLSVELLELAVRPSVPKPARAGGWSRLAAARRARFTLEALEAVIRSWPHLADESKPVGVSVGEGRWAAAARRALQSADRTAFEGICLLAEHCRDPGLAPVLLEILVGGNDAGARRADTTLLTFAASLGLDPDPSRFEPEFRLGADPVGPMQPWPPGARQEVARVVVEAAWRFGEHRQKGVLLAGLLVLAQAGEVDEVGPEARFARLIADEGHPASSAIRSLLRWSRAPVVRSLALRLLTRDDLGAACVDRLARALAESDHEVTLCQSHLVLNHARRRRLSLIRLEHVPAGGSGGPRSLPPGGSTPDQGAFAHLSPDARRGLARWVGCLSADAGGRALALEPLLADGDAHSRLAAVPGAPAALALDLCLDADERVARAAMQAWSQAGTPGWLGSSIGAAADARATMLSKLRRSPHGSVRRLASQDRLRHDPWSPQSAHSRVLARHLCERDRDAFVMDIRSRIRGGNGAAACAAILVATRLGVIPSVESELVAVASSTDPEMARAASAAVRALGSIPDARSRAAVIRCLEHSDARVRANSVEAVGRWRDDPAVHPLLIELKLDSHHRVRANAIAALLDGPAGAYDSDAAGSLMIMLDESAALTRAAAAWVAERVARRGAMAAHAGLVHQLETISTSDPDARVRWRAARGIRAVRAWDDRGGAVRRGAPRGPSSGRPAGGGTA